MTTAFLICALALSENKAKSYKLLVWFVSRAAPGYEIVLVNRDEVLMDKDAKALPVVYDGLDVWIKPRSGSARRAA